jgi:acid phosphatase (class A)
VHYRSDIQAGRIAGSVIVAALMQQAVFTAEFTAAKAELRSLLGLAPIR